MSSLLRPVVALRVFFTLALAAILFATVRASLDYSILEVGDLIGHDTWFQATLTDAYLGFLSFYCWIFHLERSRVSRLLWLIALLLLGNIAMATYALNRLLRLPADAPVRDILLRRED